MNSRPAVGMRTRSSLQALIVGLGLVVALLCMGTRPTAAVQTTDLTVCAIGCSYDNIQAAVDAAQDGDIIKVAEGTYTSMHSRPAPSGYDGTPVLAQVLYVSRTIAVQGGYTSIDWSHSNPISYPTVLDAQGLGRVILIAGSVSPTLEGLQIVNGDASGLGGGLSSADAGGGVYVLGATVTISSSRLLNNVAQVGDGGGLYLKEGSAVFRESEFSYNNAGRDGGGLYVIDSSVRADGNTFSHNSAGGDGGGAYLWASEAALTGSTVAVNSAAFNGGGLRCGESNVALDENLVADNLAGYDGGGLHLESSVATLRSNIVVSNSGHTGGGFSSYKSTVVLSGNSVFYNTATLNGGGLYVELGSASVEGNAVLSNTADRGGGLYAYQNNLRCSGNAIHGNRADSDNGGLYLELSVGELSANTIIRNVAGAYCGGVCLDRSVGTLTNSVIADNRASFAGSGAYIAGSWARLLHTTIARNARGDGTGIYITGYSLEGAYYTSTVWLTNTILVGHSAGIIVDEGSAARLVATLWYGNGMDTAGPGLVSTTRDRMGSPGFVDPEGGDYHISLPSAALDRGLNAVTTTDMDGDPRPDLCAPDLGADELPTGMECRRVYFPVLGKLHPGTQTAYPEP